MVCHLWGMFPFSLTGGFSEDSTRVSSFYNPSRPIATADTTSGDWGGGLNADGGKCYGSHRRCPRHVWLKSQSAVANEQPDNDNEQEGQKNLLVVHSSS